MHSFVNLITDTMPALSGRLRTEDLLRVTACCHATRALSELPLDLSGSALRVLQFAEMHGQRFHLRALRVSRCDQPAFDALCRLNGVQSLANNYTGPRSDC